MKQLKARITENKRIARDLYRMRLSSAYLAKNSKPGQFVEVKCSRGDEVLLRRPLGVHRISNDGIELLYEVIGKGTGSLSARKKGDMLDVIGPLGKGFSIKRNTGHERRSTILIAGGMGVAPLLCLADKMAKKKIRPYVMIGARTAAHILCEKEFKDLGSFVLVSTEDGSKGRKGYVTDCLTALLSTIDYKSSAIYACGPNPMLKIVAKIAGDRSIPCQVSVEERMACGVGVCLGCPVKVKRGGYKMVCKDGPVFDAEDIVW